MVPKHHCCPGFDSAQRGADLRPASRDPRLFVMNSWKGRRVSNSGKLRATALRPVERSKQRPLHALQRAEPSAFVLICRAVWLALNPLYVGAPADLGGIDWAAHRDNLSGPEPRRLLMTDG